MGKTLIVYFSRADENIANGMPVKLDIGNTEVAANYIKDLVPEADMFKVDPVKKYSVNYTDCTAEAKMDQSTNARPELKKVMESIDEYDKIYLGYPIYWETMPMAMFTFLEMYNWSGKVIKPFCTHEGSSFGKSLEDVASICEGATIKEGLAIHGADVRGYKFTIKRWINKED